MWIPICQLLLIAQAVSAASSSFIVQLQGDKSFDDYLQESIADLLGLKSDSTKNKIEIGSFKAFVSDFEDDLLSKLKADPFVNDIFPNTDITLFAPVPETVEDATPGSKNPVKRSVLSPNAQRDSTFAKRDGVTTQSNAPRHLARLSSREGIFNKDGPFEYKYRETGKGVTAYVLDTGIAIDQDDFEGRASHGANFVNGESDGDNNGHGTNVAGIVGSKTYGVAKDVQLVDIKVLGSNGQGSLESILKGIEWANNDRKSKNLTAVANLSLGSPKYEALNQAVDAAYEDGLSVVVAVGNADKDTEGFSPATSKNAIAVGALDDQTDTIACFSNWGSRVDIFASGAGVVSVSNNGNPNLNKWYGTSQASPIVAGLAATLLEKGVPKDQIKNEIIKMSTKDAISKKTYDENSNYKTTVNKVVYNGIENTFDTINASSTLSQDQSLRKYIEENY
ncbi:putative secreted protein [Wickerhamomyces ciferrii]|uniref:Secreted protein n=1 Tax=Wickerhamomyces ciferrii (strain ATCC 14091 / BCRC 22168 / CBS 111 / JCM 3599 / NBRC 0793 / NRRL Y-1031 F-60-10) TaxID=1206466 RepID=K0KNQ8_WICCF|nr:uncharacterized protein BN7_2292 [Wickerhamomyces ciferrii]CCH42748.1 putative secreted protein [Wickerhamomyces ciferrii]